MTSRVTKRAICLVSGTITIDRASSVQSPWLYLQAAGSDFTDGSARGIHLRWDFGGALGDQHLPKGNLAHPLGLYPTSIGFNKPEDFVAIYRAEYTDRFPLRLDFGQTVKTAFEAGSQRRWLYVLPSPVSVPSGLPNGTNVFVEFQDVAAYDALRASIDPKVDPRAFISAYSEPIEIHTSRRPFFEARIMVRATSANSALALEAISIPDLSDFDGRVLSERATLAGSSLADQTIDHTILCENVERLRLKATDVVFGTLEISTYLDTLVGYNQGGGRWTELGRFGLTADSAEAFQRLENPDKFVINQRWPRFIEPKPDTGAFTVNVANYRDKWLPTAEPGDGIREAVIQYLTLSQTDTKAIASIPSDQLDDGAHLDISYLEMLKLISLDYHIARMLGLGYIDPHPDVRPTVKYLYVAEYFAKPAASLGPDATELQHLWMSLPTAQADHRLPPAPTLSQITYGLTVDNGTPTPTVLTAPGGYDRFADRRYVNLFRDRLRHERALGSFFESSKEFSICNRTLPVAFGIKYREVSERSFRTPEVSSDPNYRDAGDLPEVALIPDQGEVDRPVYIHCESEEGVHEYALYSINWFSRSSSLGNFERTNATACGQNIPTY